MNARKKHDLYNLAWAKLTVNIHGFAFDSMSSFLPTQLEIAIIILCAIIICTNNMKLTLLGAARGCNISYQKPDPDLCGTPVCQHWSY